MTLQISNEIFADYLRCEYKAYLKLTGRTGQKTEYQKLQDRLLRQYRILACEYLFSNRYNNETSLANVPLSKLRKKTCKIAINVTATLNQFSVAIDALTLTSSSKPTQYVPVSFVHRNSVSKDDKLVRF